MTFKSLFLLFLVIHLLGCSATVQGNFSKVPTGRYQIITNDTVKQLIGLYPPAHTRFHIKQSVRDPFGLSLIESLRQKGYAINESSIYSRSTQGVQNIALYYLIDEPDKGRLYRVTIVVGQQSLSRAYTIKNATLSPLGFWVRKE